MASKSCLKLEIEVKSLKKTEKIKYFFICYPTSISRLRPHLVVNKFLCTLTMTDWKMKFKIKLKTLRLLIGTLYVLKGMCMCPNMCVCLNVCSLRIKAPGIILRQPFNDEPST